MSVLNEVYDVNSMGTRLERSQFTLRGGTLNIDGEGGINSGILA